MNIEITCDQQDCMYNVRGEIFLMCTNPHPKFYKNMGKRHCTSKLIKHKIDKDVNIDNQTK